MRLPRAPWQRLRSGLGEKGIQSLLASCKHQGIDLRTWLIQVELLDQRPLRIEPAVLGVTARIAARLAMLLPASLGAGGLIIN